VLFLICVVVVADAGDKNFFDKLTGLVCRCFTPLTIWKGAARAYGENATLLLCDHESLQSVGLLPKIIILRGNGGYGLSQVETEKTVVIVDSCDQAQLAYVSKAGLPAITCGLYGKDTVTMSSMTGERAVINLQRSITCFNGEIAEPQEIPVTMRSSLDQYLLMSAACIFILTGNSGRPIMSAPEAFC
jgi:hypothetical protein